MRGLLNLLTAAMILTLAALFAWCIGATATGDGMTDWEQQVAMWIGGVGFALFLAGSLLDAAVNPKGRR